MGQSSLGGWGGLSGGGAFQPNAQSQFNAGLSQFGQQPGASSFGGGFGQGGMGSQFGGMGSQFGGMGSQFGGMGSQFGQQSAAGFGQGGFGQGGFGQGGFGQGGFGQGGFGQAGFGQAGFGQTGAAQQVAQTTVQQADQTVAAPAASSYGGGYGQTATVTRTTGAEYVSIELLKKEN